MSNSLLEKIEAAANMLSELADAADDAADMVPECAGYNAPAVALLLAVTCLRRAVDSTRGAARAVQRGREGTP